MELPDKPQGDSATLPPYHTNMEVTLKNQLADATSPYLQQHADNPVAWQEWSEEALAAARELNRPILLSIGYSACHWCHVMAHESFENADTAASMNALFVNIKVDREERPDLDKIYQTANQLLNQRPGGWPLTLFLDPNTRLPFFSGTYFPVQARHGLPAFRDVLTGVYQAWGDQRSAIANQSESLEDALSRLAETANDGKLPSPEVVFKGVAQLKQNHDAVHGGFGRAPKFPHPGNLALLLRHARREDDASALNIATFTLERMALGGVYDQIGGGFCRYSVDERWMIPHFEKMLYDNGSLLALYADAWVQTRDALFRTTCESLVGWLFREMQSAEGAFWSSQDADSEGEEGRYYVWTREEIQVLLQPDEFQAFAACYGIDDKPNFEGKWNPHAAQRPETLRERFPDIDQRLRRGRSVLLNARQKRVPPGIDDKILTSWNALIIAGLARAGRLLGKEGWIEAAGRALRHLKGRHWQHGRLLASYKNGRAHLPAYLDDHAYLLRAILELLQARWSSEDLEFGMALADLLLDRFEDKESGGFFFTADDHESLIQRPKPMIDDAMPSGNGIAAQALLQLGHLTGQSRYLDAARHTLEAAAEAMRQTPYAHAALLIALDSWRNPDPVIVLRGQPQDLKPWSSQLYGHSACPAVYPIPEDAVDLPDQIAAKPAGEDVLGYLCTGTHCESPVASCAELLSALTVG